MNATTLLQHLEDYLKPLVIDEDSGVFSIAADPAEALEMLAANSPKRWRLALIFAGYEGIEQNDGDDSFAHALLKLYVQLPASSANQPANELHRTQAGGTPPMLDRIEKVRLWLSRLRLNVDGVDCRQFRFQGSEWETETRSGKALNRTHRLDFEVALALDVAATDVVWPPA
jgi:hypothetical protein